jgi:diguanylate cyclase (GGDEF)-like protein
MAQEVVVGPAQPPLEAAADDGEQRHPSAVQSPVVRGYVGGVVTTAVVLTVVALMVRPGSGATANWIGSLAVLLVAYLAAELVALNVEVRNGTVTIPLVEVPLAGALLLATLPATLAASALTLIGRALWQRQHWMIALFNLAASSIEISSAFITAGVLANAGASDLVAVFGGLVACELVGGVNAVGLSIAMGGQRARRHLTVTTMTMSVVAPLLVVAAIQMLRLGAAGWLLLAVVLTAFAALFRAYSVLLRERKDLSLVQEITSTMGEAGDVWPTLSELIRQQFNASRVVVLPPDAQSLSVAGDQLSNAQQDAILQTSALMMPADASTQLWSASKADGREAKALRDRGASEVLVAQLGSGAGAGLIELHDRQNQIRGFGSSDIRLLDTLAKHIATAVDNRRLVSELRDAAYHDRLTGLANRLGFAGRVSEAFADRKGDSEPAMFCTVLLVGLGAIGQVNDALGHGWGDRLVYLAAERVSATVARLAGPGSLVSRLEGDTFAVLIWVSAIERSEEVAEQLAADLAMPYPMEDLAVESSPAIGVAMVSPQTHQLVPDIEQMLQQADVAMQAARAAGQPVRTYHPSMGQVFLRRFQLVTQFRSALDNGEVTVHYQPKLSLSERRVIGSEALMRWTHPEFGPVDPEELVQVLEATGLIDDLTRFVLDDALLRCRTLLDGGVRIDPAVNVSVRNLLSPSFPGMVASALAKHRVPAEMLTLEITETSVMGDAEHALPALRVLHEMGVMLSVDDFGTGYSSLSYLRRLPVDEVKIDKSFVLGMGTDLGDLAVVRAIIDLGRSLGLRVVAEGVETDVVRDQLAEMGCDVVQGYLIARAMTPERFDSWLHARTVSTADGSGHNIAAPRLSS